LRYLFEDCVLDTDLRELHRGAEAVSIAPQVFDLLDYLIRNRDRVVSKDDLIAAIWEGRVVSDAALTTRLNVARRAIGDSGETQRLIKTLPRKGFRFVGTVRAEQRQVNVASEELIRPALALPDMPSIAVLPFANLSSDPEQEYLAGGIVEDIITELSRFSELFVIARNSSFQFKGKAVDVRQVGCKLGVRYVLEGSVRRFGDRIRITAQLIDATTGTHRWAEHYDRKLDDVFSVQDEVVGTIVAILAAHVRQAEIERTRARPPNSWQAYDYYLQAQARYGVFHRAMKVATLYEARQILDRCLAIDSTFARAYVLWSTTKTTSYVLPLDSDQLTDEAIDTAHQLIQKAVEFGDQLPEAHAQLGYVLGFLRQYDLAILEFERAFSANTNFTDWRFPFVLTRAGQPARAMEVAKAHMRLDPFCLPIAQGYLGHALYSLKQYEGSASVLRDFVSRAPNHTPGRLWLAAAYAQLGHLPQARAEVLQALRLEPDLSLARRQKLTVYKYPEDEDHFLDGLRRAGVPE
jgi:adenylate cyclase